MTTQELLRQWRDEKDWHLFNYSLVPDEINSLIEKHNATLARQRLAAELLGMAMDGLFCDTNNRRWRLRAKIQQRLIKAAKGEK